MIFDDMTRYDLFELLEQARHELRTCKKSLLFKENLLAELEQENAELTETKERLDKELKSLKRQELRRSELDNASDDGIDAGYDHWDELLEQIDELHKQLQVVQNVNKVLEEDVNQKSAQIVSLTASLLEKQAQEERLTADLRFTAAEREIALRDLHDVQDSSVSSRSHSEECLRSTSIGSSIGEELGLPNGFPFPGERPYSRASFDWEELLEEPEAGPVSDFEEAQASMSGRSSVESEMQISVDLGEARSETSDELATSVVEIQTEQRQIETESGILAYPTPKSSPKGWNANLFSDAHSFNWGSFVCCVPTPNSPVRPSPRKGKTSRGFLTYMKSKLRRNSRKLILN
ncbi:uncharacterized protein LOC100898418 [Galendromus occidentalis]|uniref:Uncharacterized protein LOC100898418 n=1 Tax=Galendromus occidentalis TaxID=34638 RepID=A0AAJ6QU01_9ACAR|nr:uncharacterized protein LOC100898418 [Galendromus occidentalis]